VEQSEGFAWSERILLEGAWTMGKRAGVGRLVGDEGITKGWSIGEVDWEVKGWVVVGRWVRMGSRVGGLGG
jgi:hypothetical protein